jgi:hypothetical protein
MDLVERRSAVPIDMPPPVIREPRPGTEIDAGAPRAENGPGVDSPGAAAFARVFDLVGRETERGERAVRAALDARQTRRSDPGDLLALQAAVYRYTEVVDLASRLLDRASSALKTVLGGAGS